MKKMITIPKPCSENWNAMQELEKSRFCATCQKCVIDFTILSDDEILKIINTKNANICGRFNEKQINRVLKTPNTYNIRYTKTFFSLTLASFLGFQNHIHAKPFLKTHIEQLNKKDEKTIKVKSNSTDSIVNEEIILKGRLIDDDSQEPLVGGAIIIKGSEIGAVTDENGRFELKIPKVLANSSLIFLAQFVGYQTQEIQFNANTPINELEIKLKTTWLGEVVVVGGVSAIKHPFLYKIKYKFRNLINRIRD